MTIRHIKNDPTFVGTVQFETKEAANTALLLSNAYIYDKPIQVASWTSEHEILLKDMKLVSKSDFTSGKTEG